MKWVNFFRSEPDKPKYYAIFEETYNKVLKQLRESHIGFLPDRELWPFLFVLTDYAVTSAAKDRDVALTEISVFINELIPTILFFDMDLASRRMVLYSEIICGKPIRPDWKHLFNEETLSGENATPKLFLALIDILTNPACAEDYENAPVFYHDNIFEAIKFQEPMERIFSDIVEFFGKIYKA